MPAPKPARFHLFLLASALAIFIWSGIAPSGYKNWVAETFPAMIGGVLLVVTYRRFRFTSVTYFMVWVFAIILMVGGHYTYANVPIGNYVRDILQLHRNHFDRVGHFFQGVVPAMVGRELFLRTSPLRRGGWLFFICVCVALAISASYEIFEWRYAVTFGGQQADDFLGSQGDVWDTQEDMTMALIGSIVGQLALGAVQNRQLREMGVKIDA